MDGGRQLFVDNFLVDTAKSSAVETTFHNATYRDDVNPVLKPDKVDTTSPGLSHRLTPRHFLLLRQELIIDYLSDFLLELYVRLSN